MTDVGRLIAEAARIFGVSAFAIAGRGRVGPVAEARQAVMWALCRSGWTTVAAGQALGRDHSTVTHAVQQMDADRASDPRLQAGLLHLCAVLAGQWPVLADGTCEKPVWCSYGKHWSPATTFSPSQMHGGRCRACARLAYQEPHRKAQARAYARRRAATQRGQRVAERAAQPWPVCGQCGAAPTRTRRARYCASCVQERQKAQQRAWQQAHPRPYRTWTPEQRQRHQAKTLQWKQMNTDRYREMQRKAARAWYQRHKQVAS